MPSETTKAFATHPADRDRIASAARERAPGLFQIEAPATVLFHDYDRVAREVTLVFYKNVIGQEVEPRNLIPTSRLVAEQSDRLEGHKAVRRYLQGDVSSEYRLFLGAIELSQSIEPSQAKDQLRAARARMLEALPRYQEALKAFLEADQNRDRAEIVATRMAGGIRDDASGLKLSAAGHAAAKQAREELGAARNRATPRSRRGGTTNRRPHAVGLSAALRARNRRRRPATAATPPPHAAGSYSMREKRSVAPGRTSKICVSKWHLLGTLFNDLNNNKENTSLVTADQVGRLANHGPAARRTCQSGRRALPLRTWQRNDQHRHGFRCRRFLDRKNSPSFLAPRRAWLPSTTHSTTVCSATSSFSPSESRRPSASRCSPIPRRFLPHDR